MKYLLFTIGIYIMSSLHFVHTAFAQSGSGSGSGGGSGSGSGGGSGSGSGGGSTGGGTSIQNPLGDQTLIGFFQDILDVIMVFAVPIIVFFIIYAGFMYVTANGKEEQVRTASKALLYAVIGGVIILGANILLDVISGTVDALGA